MSGRNYSIPTIDYSAPCLKCGAGRASCEHREYVAPQTITEPKTTKVPGERSNGRWAHRPRKFL